MIAAAAPILPVFAVALELELRAVEHELDLARGARAAAAADHTVRPRALVARLDDRIEELQLRRAAALLRLAYAPRARA